MDNFKKFIIFCFIISIICVPATFAFDDKGNVDNGVYYFDSNAVDDKGNGSIDNPYKTITGSRIHSNSVMYVNDGVYDQSFWAYPDNVTIIGKNTSNTIIKGATIKVYSGGLRIYNVTLINAKIINEGYNFTFTNSVLKDTACYTGIITSKSGSYINIVNSTFENNVAEQYAGVIYCENSKLTITNSSFTNNYAQGDAGGAIYAINSEIVANYVNISNSSATFGGAITSLSSKLTLNNFTSANNKAKYRGGAIYAMYGEINIADSVFENNTATDGGAIFFDYLTINLSSNTFTKNTASSIGGAIYVMGNKQKTIVNNTFIDNLALFNNDYYETLLPNITIGNNDYILIYYNSSSVSDIPDKYDLRKLNQVSSVKDQGHGGNCWAFATLASLESCILKATGKEFDLSEENMKNLMAYYSEYGWSMNTNDGGYLPMGIGYLVSWLGAVNESDDEYDGKSLLSPVLNSFIHVQNVLFLKRTNYTDNDEIKRAIMEHGGVATSVYWDTNNYLDDKYNGKNYYNNEVSDRSNHAVLIVGWDDNYSKDNFKGNPEGDGAWIIKNSWGSYNGENGYYYVSYYDLRLAPINSEKTTFTFVLADSFKFDKNYQYDIQGLTDYLVTPNETLWYKNKFIATDDEYLTAVSTYFEKQTSWTLSVYVNGELKLTQSGVSGESYKTIELNEFIPLKNADEFEIVFKVNNYAGVPISEKNQPLNNLFSAPGVSYLSYDGTNWQDLYYFRGQYDGHNYYGYQVACIKAFTVLNKINTTLTLTQNPLSNSEITATVLNQYGNPVNTGRVVFTIDGKTYTVNVTNGVAKLNHRFDSSKTVLASFSNTGYGNSSSNITISVKQIILNAEDLVTFYNETVYYSVNLTHDDLRPFVGEEVSFTINNKKYTDITNNKGVATIAIKLNTGSYDIVINDNTVKKITVKATITLAQNTVYAYNAKYGVYLVDVYGNPLKDTDVVINNQIIKTDEKGYLSYNINLVPGSYLINIINPNTTQNTSQNINVVARITQNVNMIMYYGAGKYYKVKVVDDNGNVKKNLKVAFKINGATYYKYTDENGYASIKIGLNHGTYTVYATYNGYTVSNKITVKPTIITKNIVIKKAKTGKFTAKLIDAKGKVIKYKYLTVKFKSKTYKIKTNKYGIATLSIGKTYAAKKYTITTSYLKQTVKNTITIK